MKHLPCARNFSCAGDRAVNETDRISTQKETTTRNKQTIPVLTCAMADEVTITVEGDMGEKCATVVRVTGQGCFVGETRMVQEREPCGLLGKEHVKQKEWEL